MAITIKQSFEGLKSNLEITQLQTSTVSDRQQNVRRVMESGLVVKDSFLTGSYKRNTMITPLNEADIDIFIILDVKYFYHYNGQNGGQAGLLDLTKRTLKKTYTRTPDVSRNGQAVTITFDDFVVDVVPAFYRKNGGYLIPNANSKTWIETDPTAHITVMNDQNRIHQGMLIPLVKMLKKWNKNINQAFVSFYLELLAINIFSGVTINDYSSGVRYFFDKGREAIKFKVKDPVAYGGEINGLRSVPTVQEAISRFETAYSRAIRAEEYAKKGYISDAIEEWRKIFGNYFPAYG